MAVTRWHILRDGPCLTVARHLPARLDVVAETVLPRANPLRLAHQIRQDMWRALQRLRGFSPVVSICTLEEEMHIRAGGRVIGTAPPATVSRIAAVLENRSNRARWVRFAGEDRT
ncbi:MAG: hypothetical protein AB3N23_19105 [Paracoccaceae bacterium]